MEKALRNYMLQQNHLQAIGFGRHKPYRGVIQMVLQAPILLPCHLIKDQ